MQDFTRRIVIVVDKNLESWQVLNTVAHISAYLGNKMPDRFDTGEFFETKDGKNHPRNSQFPIIIFSAKPQQLKELIQLARNSGLLYLGFIKEMIETSNDQEIVNILNQKLDSNIEYLGIGFFGENDQIKLLTKKFSLWK